MNRTEENLKGLHPDLITLVHHVLDNFPGLFVVTEGLRTIERQKRLLVVGATTTLKSRHLTGHAFDIAALVDGEVRWDWPLYRRIADIIKVEAKTLNIGIQWGGDWVKFKDGPHFQLDPKRYP